MLGEASKDKYVTTGGAETGNHIVLTKGVGIEGTGILAADFKDRLSNISNETIKKAIGLLDLISVVLEAEIATNIGGVTSMHTPTEGGVLNGLLEISGASGKGFKIYEEKLLIHPETSLICDTLGINPLRLLSSGSLLIVIKPKKSAKLVKKLGSKGVSARVIGEITDGLCVIVGADGSESVVSDVVQDELFRVLDESN
jgi:hydrogenase maturation factor